MFKWVRSIFGVRTYRTEFREKVLSAEAESAPSPGAIEPSGETGRDVLLGLEAERKAKGFKPGWLFYRAVDLRLEEEHRALIQEGLLERTEKPMPRGPDEQIIQIPSPWEAPRLSIELVPSSCWFSNLRSLLTEEEWKDLKRRTFGAAGRTCLICRGRGEKWPVECHEVWGYRDGASEQFLERLLALCPDCHEAKHPGMASIEGRAEEALAHLARLNGWSLNAAQHYTALAFKEWQERSRKKWTIEVSLLHEYGFSDKRIQEIEEAGRSERKLPQENPQELREGEE